MIAYKQGDKVLVLNPKTCKHKEFYHSELVAVEHDCLACGVELESVYKKEDWPKTIDKYCTVCKDMKKFVKIFKRDGDTRNLQGVYVSMDTMKRTA